MATETFNKRQKASTRREKRDKAAHALGRKERPKPDSEVQKKTPAVPDDVFETSAKPGIPKYLSWSSGSRSSRRKYQITFYAAKKNKSDS